MSDPFLDSHLEQLERLIYHRQLITLTLTAIPELPPAERTALVLVALEGVPPAELAEVLGVSHVAIRRRLSDARRRLRARVLEGVA